MSKKVPDHIAKEIKEQVYQEVMSQYSIHQIFRVRRFRIFYRVMI